MQADHNLNGLLQVRIILETKYHWFIFLRMTFLNFFYDFLILISWTFSHSLIRKSNQSLRLWKGLQRYEFCIWIEVRMRYAQKLIEFFTKISVVICLCIILLICLIFDIAVIKLSFQRIFINFEKVLWILLSESKLYVQNV